MQNPQKAICVGLALLAAGLTGILGIGCKKQPSSNPPKTEPPVQTHSDDTQNNPAPQAAHTGVRWYTNFEQAQAAAQKENKDLLINFSGSDWCIFCIKLEKEVFSQDSFAKEAEKYFVFMLVDFPGDPSSQPAEIRKQNEQLAERYHFRKLFPTLYLARPDGTPYAMAEYQGIGPKEYLDYLLKIRQYRDR